MCSHGRAGPDMVLRQHLSCGADPARGSGLVGLTDRVEALGGSIQVRSRVGDGTHITAELPLERELERNPEQPSP